MKLTLKYRYVKLPQIKLILNIKPMGTMLLRYTLPVIGTFFRESSVFVNLAMSCVMSVPNTMCQLVRKMG